MRFLFLIALLSAAGGKRQQEQEILVEVASPTRSPGRRLPSTENVEYTLTTLGFSAKKWHEEFAPSVITKIGELDWSGDIGGSLTALSTEVVGTLLDFVHPLLASFFSFFVGLFGGGDSNLLEDIQELVEKVVTMKLNTFLKEVIAWNIAGVVDTIQMAGDDSASWKLFHMNVADSFSKVFVSCWLEPSTDECRKWRTTGSAGAGLLLELYFTDLMIMATVTMASYGHNCEGLATLVLRAAGRSKDHLEVFKECRLHGACRLVKGMIQHGRSGGRIIPSKDLLLDREFCQKLPKGSPLLEDLEGSYDSCFRKEEQEVERELGNLEKNAVANLKAATAIQRGAARAEAAAEKAARVRSCEVLGLTLCLADTEAAEVSEPWSGKCLKLSACEDLKAAAAARHEAFWVRRRRRDRRRRDSESLLS